VNSKQIQPDYGIDSPYIILGLSIAVGICLAMGLVLSRAGHSTGRWVAFAVAAYFGQGSIGMLLYSKVTKLRMREEFLNSIPWRGDEQVLDIGCGRGLLTIAAAKRLRTGKVTGVDVWLPKAMTGNRSSAVLENAAAEGVADRVTVEQADAQDLPFPDESLDIVVANFVLHEIDTVSGRQKMVEEIARVLKPGGYVALRDFIFTDVCVAELSRGGVPASRERVGGLSFWAGAILNLGFFRLYHVTGRKEVTG
jgi:SAM-dependent methyltransferase